MKMRVGEPITQAHVDCFYTTLAAGIVAEYEKRTGMIYIAGADAFARWCGQNVKKELREAVLEYAAIAPPAGGAA